MTTMTQAEALRTLIEVVKTGAIDDENRYWTLVVDALGSIEWFHQAYDGDFNAAYALHKALLPGWHYAIDGRQDGAEAEVFTKPVKGDSGYLFIKHSHSASLNEPNPARAWLIAILEAKFNDEEKS